MTKPSSLDNMPALLSPNDLSEVTGLSAGAIRHLMRGAESPAVKIGRSWYCPKASFRDYVMGRAYGVI